MLTALALAALLQTPAIAAVPPPAPTRVIAFDRRETTTTGPALQVASTSLTADGFFQLTNSGYGRNYSPSVQWSQGPAATKSYVLIVEDTDAGQARPLLHWLAYDIGADILSMKDKTKNMVHVTTPAPADPDAVVVTTGRRKDRPKEGPSFDQGPNDHGGVGWTGPHPPVGDPPHHYHLQVFALDRKDIGKPGLEYDAVLAAMRGHVVAKGEMIALYRQSPDKVRGPRKAAAPEPETAAVPPPETATPKL